MSIERPYVVICVASLGTWCAKMAMNTIELAMASMQVAEVGIAQAEHGAPANSRNLMVMTAKQIGAEYVLFIDSDMQFPPDGLAQLLEAKKDVVGVFYPRRGPPHNTVGHILGELPTFEEGPVGLWPADQLGCGFLLIRTSVFDKVPYPWFQEYFDPKYIVPEVNPTGFVTDDTYFCQKALAAGIELWVDMDLSFRIGHIFESTIAVGRPKPFALKQEVAA